MFSSRIFSEVMWRIERDTLLTIGAGGLEISAIDSHTANPSRKDYHSPFLARWNTLEDILCLLGSDVVLPLPYSLGGYGSGRESHLTTPGRGINQSIDRSRRMNELGFEQKAGIFLHMCTHSTIDTQGQGISISRTEILSCVVVTSRSTHASPNPTAIVNTSSLLFSSCFVLFIYSYSIYK